MNNLLSKKRAPVFGHKVNKRKRINNFEQPKITSLTRKNKMYRKLKNLWSHGRILSCKECEKFNDHLADCAVSNLNRRIEKIEEANKLNLNCLICFRFSLHLSSFKCTYCFQWCLSKHFNRHIDNCKKSPLEKDFCFKCRRECHLELTCNEGIWHTHICSRKPKRIRKCLESSKRKRIFRNMNKEGTRKINKRKKKYL